MKGNKFVDFTFSPNFSFFVLDDFMHKWQVHSKPAENFIYFGFGFIRAIKYVFQLLVVNTLSGIMNFQMNLVIGSFFDLYSDSSAFITEFDRITQNTFKDAVHHLFFEMDARRFFGKFHQGWRSG